MISAAWGGDMVLRFYSLLLAISFLAASQVAQAGSWKDDGYVPASGPWYVEGRLGVPFSGSMESQVSNTFGAAGDATLDYDFDEAYFGSLAVGYYFAPRWRVEAAFGLGHADDPSINFKVADPTNLFQGPVPSTGELDTVSAYGYLIRDFRRIRGITPFAGVGAGLVRYKPSNLRPVGSFFVLNDADTVASFAWLAGLEMPMSERVSLTVRYSGAYTDGPTFKDVRGGGILSVENSDFVTHYVALGVKLSLGAQ